MRGDMPVDGLRVERWERIARAWERSLVRVEG